MKENDAAGGNQYYDTIFASCVPNLVVVLFYLKTLFQKKFGEFVDLVELTVCSVVTNREFLIDGDP